MAVGDGCANSDLCPHNLGECISLSALYSLVTSYTRHRPPGPSPPGACLHYTFPSLLKFIYLILFISNSIYLIDLRKDFYNFGEGYLVFPFKSV